MITKGTRLRMVNNISASCRAEGGLQNGDPTVALTDEDDYGTYLIACPACIAHSSDVSETQPVTTPHQLALDL